MASAMGLLLAPSVMEAESKGKDKSLYSEANAPDLYGTKKAIVHQSDKVSIIDPRYRVLAMDHEDGDLTDKIKLISIDGNQNYQDKIDAKTGELKGLDIGKHTLLYQVTDSHNNTTQFTTEIEIVADSKEGHKEDVIQKDVRINDDAWHVTNANMRRGYDHDRQALGVQLNPGESIKARVLSGHNNLTFSVMTDSQLKDNYQKVNGSETTISAKTDDEVNNIKGLRGDKDGTGAVFVDTPRSSDKKETVIEYKVDHETRHTPYYHTGDDPELFFKSWEDDVKGKDSKERKGYAVIEGQDYMIMPPSGDKKGYAERFNKPGALDELNQKYERLFKQYDSFVGLELNPKDPIDQRVRSRYFMRADANGMGGAYYGQKWIAVNGRHLDGWFTNMGWGTFHEIAHGYQGNNSKDNQVYYIETTNNILSYFAQHNPEIAGEIKDYWMDLSTYADSRFSMRNNAIKNHAPKSKKEAEDNPFKWQTFSKYMDEKGRLYFFVNMMESINPDNPGEVWAEINKTVRRYAKAHGKDNSTNAVEHIFKTVAEKYGVNLVPYMMEWGSTRILPTQEKYAMQKNSDNVGLLRDLIYNKEKREEVAQKLGLKEHNFARTSELLKLNIPGKAKIKLDITDKELEELKGKSILLYNDGKLVKEVKIDGKKEIDVDLPIGVYTAEFPKLYKDRYEYNYNVPYVFSTDQNVDKNAKAKGDQYFTTWEYKKGEEKKTLSKDSLVVLGKEGISEKVGPAFMATVSPQPGRPTSNLHLTINPKYVVFDRVEIKTYTQVLANTDVFLPKPTSTYIAEKGKPFPKQDKTLSIEDGDVLSITTTSNNYGNIKGYSETGVEYEFNRPKTETTYYRINNKGFRANDINPEDVEGLLYEQEKVKTIKELEEKLKKLPEDFYSSRNAYAPLKAEIIALYNKLKPGDQEQFKTQIEKIQQGGAPQITWKSAKSTDEKLVVSDDKVSSINWEDEISVIDPEDGRVPKEKIKISANTKRWTTPDEYKVHVEAEDMDGNKSEQELTVQVVPKKDFEEVHTQECEKQIDDLDFLDSDEKSKAKEKLKEAHTTVDLTEIVAKAKVENAKRMIAARDKVMTHLAKYKDVDTSEQSQIKDALDKCKTKEEMTKFHAKVKTDVEKRIKDAYDKAVSDLAKYKEITEEEKTTVKEKLAKTETRAEIKKIMDGVEKEDSARQLKDKDSIYNNLCKYKDLSEDEKKEIKAALDSAKTKEDLQRIREAVKAKVEARLQEEYAKATEALTQCSKLTAEEQAQATAALEQSETRDKMKEIVQKAKEENDKRAQKEDTDIKEEVEQIKDLSPQEKEEVLAAAEKLESKEELEALLAMVKEKIKQRVEEAYLLAQQQISVFGFLPKEKQEALQEKLKDVESRAEIEAIVKEAEKENQTQKEEEQQKVVEEIQNSTLTDKEKEEWIQKVEQAESKDDLDQIKETVDKVEEEQKDQWKEEKEQLIKELSYYSFITRNEKSTVKDAILASDSLETLEKIRTALKQTEAQRLAQGKLELKQSIEKEGALSKESKAHFLSQVKEARTKEDLERIQSDVWKIVVDKEDQLRPLKEQVESWIEKNSFLTETEKSNAKRTLNALQSEEAVYHFAKELQEDTAKTRHQLEQQMRNEIQNLSYLSEKDKAHYAQLLTQAQDKRAMESILAQAKEMNRYYESSAFNQKQRELKARIQRLNLPKEEKDKWLQKVTNTKYLAELEMIEDHIQSAEKDYLEEQKQAVAKELASYQLTKEQRQALMEKLKAAQTETELQEIVNEAKSYHKENTKPKMHKEMQYLSFKKNTTILWNDVYLEAQKGTAASYLAQICKTKGYYIINGEKYWSVYNNKNKWLGYVKASEVETFQGPWQLQSQKSFKVKIAKKDYPIWKDLSLESKKGTTKSHYKKTYTVKRTYRHFNGKTYYSLYNIQTNKWTGYVDSGATKKVK